MSKNHTLQVVGLILLFSSFLQARAMEDETSQYRKIQKINLSLLKEIRRIDDANSDRLLENQGPVVTDDESSGIDHILRCTGEIRFISEAAFRDQSSRQFEGPKELLESAKKTREILTQNLRDLRNCVR